MYSAYEKRVNNILQSNNTNNFKNDKSYNSILEHVTYEQGVSYISLKRQTIRCKLPIFSNYMLEIPHNLMNLL